VSLQNLIEDFLYDLLPEAVIDLDEQGLIQAVVGGYQDRVDDLRSYISKFELLMTGSGVPETDQSGAPVNNVVLCQVQSPQGKVYNRSLDIQDDTPDATDTAALFTWTLGQLQLDESHVLISAAYGVDMLRLVDANILAYLASTIGAVLYQTAAMDPNNSQNDARRLLQTWFPRLQFKGTAQSFETLGRLLGFDDVRMMPLFSRLSPRISNDIGDPRNNQDFATVPEYFPKQARDNFYDPLVQNDGPFYTWTGTASTVFGTNDTRFYEEVINGFNPFVTVTQVGTAPQNPDPNGSPYILVGGGPEVQASVIPPGSQLLFKAISSGSSFNGLKINVESIDNGTYRVISITDRLSAIKYRSSYYDLALTLSWEHALAQFGTNVASPNKDLAADPSFTNFGSVALSPFRPWQGGSVAQGSIVTDWLNITQSNGNLAVIVPRSQATLASREVPLTDISAAAAQVVQAMEEVRPATRRPRQINTGLLMEDPVGFAKYCAEHSLFTSTAAQGTYSGTLTDYPLPPYNVEFLAGTATGTLPLIGETDLINSGFVRFRSTDLLISGTFNYSNATWLFAFTGVHTGTHVISTFTPTSTEVIRPDPGTNCVEMAYQARPEDKLDDPTIEFADENPWRRDLIGGGELIDFDTYQPAQPDIQTVRLGQTTSVFSQTGAQYDVQVIVPGPYPPRFVTAERNLDDYVPGQQAIAFTGTFLNLASVGTFVMPPLVTPSIRITETGNIRITEAGDVRIIEQSQTGTVVTEPMGYLDNVLQPDWHLYHFGLVQGVLVADPKKFFGDHHRTGLALWYPFDEQPFDAIEVLDHSIFDGRAFVNGISPNDRKFDPVRGNYLAAQPGMILNSPLDRGFHQQFSGGFWLRAMKNYSSEQTLLISGPLQINLAGATNTPQVKFYLLAPNGTANLQATQTFNQEWVYVAWSFDGNQTLTIDFWNSAGSLTQQVITVTTPIDFGTPYHFSLFCQNTAFDIQDLRLWNVPKNSTKLALARYHNPNPTACLYRPTWLESANTYDHYSVRVLPSGYLVPDELPTSIITNKLAWVQRYDYLGRYNAQSRYKETGLGSGNALPPVQYLGAQWDALTADGTVAVSTWEGNFVGFNNVWLTTNQPGTNVVLTQAGSTPNGFVGIVTSTGTSSPWPNPLVATNPNRDRIWVPADDNSVWQIMLSNVKGTVSFETEKLFSVSGSYQPTGNLSFLAGAIETTGVTNVVFSPGNVLTLYVTNHTSVTILGSRFSRNLTSFGVSNVLPGQTVPVISVVPGSNAAWFFTLDGITIYSESSVSHSTDVTYTFGGSGHTKLNVSSSGSVYAGSFSGSFATDPIYLYSTRETLVNLSGTDTVDAWVQPNNFGMGQTPPVPALNHNGQIAFQIDDTLATGFYRLEVTSGNIGKVDSSFAGFATVVTVGDVVFQAQLCAGQTGADFEKTDSFDFFLSHDLPGSPSSWLLSFDWNNALKDVSKGTMRQLFISGVKLTRAHSSLYKVTPADTTIGLTRMDTSSQSYGTTPGGWLALMTSWGTVYQYAHESNVYSSNDTVRDPEPLSNKMTASTLYRREDLILNGSFTIPDPATPPLTVYGPISHTGS
jgi:hypothetical protein